MNNLGLWDRFLIWIGWKQPPKPKKKITTSKKPVEQQKKVNHDEEERRIERAMRLGDEMALTELHYSQSQTNRGFSPQKFFIPFFEEEKQNRKISFNFIPKTQANKNVRSFLEYKTKGYKAWQTVRNTNQERAGNLCIACGCSSTMYGKKYHTECHENWLFGRDESHRNIQKLQSLQALCMICHKIKHMNAENDMVIREALLERYAEINGISILTAKNDYDTAIIELEEKNRYKYQLDLEYLEKYDLPQKDRYFDCNKQEFIEFLETFNDD